MMRKRGVAICVVCLAWLGEAFGFSITTDELAGLTWTFTRDSQNDAASGARVSFETYGMGHAISEGFLYVIVQTNFPRSGSVGSDSYTGMTHFSPGDLYLNVGGSFQNGGGSVYGIATTTHANVVQQAYHGPWQAIHAGRLYTSPDFATGTFEQYQLSEPGYVPEDGDGNRRQNSYPTLMRSGTLTEDDVSGVLYRSTTSSDWAFEIVYKVALSALGLSGGPQDPATQAFWVMECGNDGVEHFIKPNRGGDPTVPEPATFLLLAAGLSALAARRRRLIL